MTGLEAVGNEKDKRKERAQHQSPKIRKIRSRCKTPKTSNPLVIHRFLFLFFVFSLLSHMARKTRRPCSHLLVFIGLLTPTASGSFGLQAASAWYILFSHLGFSSFKCLTIVLSDMGGCHSLSATEARKIMSCRRCGRGIGMGSLHNLGMMGCWRGRLGFSGLR